MQRAQYPYWMQVIKKNGICIIYDENSAGVIYEHICDNMKLEVPEGFENKIYMGMDWSEMNLIISIAGKRKNRYGS